MERSLAPNELAMRVLLAIAPREHQREIRIRVAMPCERNALGIHSLRERKPRDVAAADGVSRGVGDRTRATRRVGNLFSERS